MSTTNVEQTKPAPPTFNAANGITSTREFLQNVLQPESAQQGQPAANSPNTYSGTSWADAGSVRWE
jgi:hypothetical protein